MPPWPVAELVHVSLTTDGHNYSSNPKSVLLSKAPEETALSTFIRGQSSYAEPSMYVLDCFEVDKQGANSEDQRVNLQVAALDERQYLHYIDVHRVESVNPKLVPLKANVMLTIKGQNFSDVGSLRVRFCGPSSNKIIPAILGEEPGTIQVRTPRLERCGAYSISVSLSIDDGFDEVGWTAPHEVFFYDTPQNLALVQVCVPQLVKSSLIIGGQGLGAAFIRPDNKSDDFENTAVTKNMHVYIRFSYSNKESVVRGICVTEPPSPDVLVMHLHNERKLRRAQKWNSYVFCQTPKISHLGKVKVSLSYNQVNWHKCIGHLSIYEQPFVVGACLVKRKLRRKNGHTRKVDGTRMAVCTLSSSAKNHLVTQLKFSWLFQPYL